VVKEFQLRFDKVLTKVRQPISRVQFFGPHDILTVKCMGSV